MPHYLVIFSGDTTEDDIEVYAESLKENDFEVSNTIMGTIFKAVPVFIPQAGCMVIQQRFRGEGGLRALLRQGNFENIIAVINDP
ncbi:hypothetical protein PMG11_01903 [Penicillium brasilianum]|uniref:Uncharacterized protein n=1 Tax=Penicillium brasilianum TaxID=104259 RepID=A0A0F7TGJ8_PENBI|nr:hypothetical protein PMG11_01903 [Penicillium brasilianum]